MAHKKLKLLIVSDYFYPHWTGIAKSLYFMIQAIEKEYDITILTVNYTNNLPKKEKLFSSKIIRVPFQLSFSRSKYSFLYIIKFFSLIKSYDIIFINSPCVNILPVAMITKLFGKKLRIFHQGDLILPGGLANRIIETIFNISSFISFLLSDKISTYTLDYAEHSRIMKYFLKKTYPVIFPISFSQEKQRFQKLEKIKLLKEQYILFGFAGRFVEEKGFDVLFDAIPDIVKEIPKAHFIYAGEVNMGYEHFFEKNKEKYENVKQYISCIGLLNDACMTEFYKLIDFIIIPSRSDCFNLVQAEAMLSGVPSIVSDIPGARVLVKETGFGDIFQTENPGDLVEKLMNATVRKKDLETNYKKVLKFLEYTYNVTKIREFIEK